MTICLDYLGELNAQMQQRTLIAFGTVIALVCGTSVIASERTFRREARNATDYIIWALTLETSPSARASREHCRNHCGDNGAGIEVAVDLLGAGGQATTGSLLNLLAVRLDAGPSESRSCQIAKRGKAIIPALRKLAASSASQWCQTTFNRLRKRELADIKDVPIGDICRPAKAIDAERREWLAALQSRHDLFAESGPC